jgi:hypothetical protein
MKEKNQTKVSAAKSFLDKNNICYIEMNNGQMQVDGINFWATTGKWYNPKTSEKGEGINSFVKYLKENNYVM